MRIDRGIVSVEALQNFLDQSDLLQRRELRNLLLQDFGFRHFGSPEMLLLYCEAAANRGQSPISLGVFRFGQGLDPKLGSDPIC